MYLAKAKLGVTMQKQPFDISNAMDRIRQAVQPFPKAAMFELAEKGYKTLFQQLIGCIISIRTYDEVSLPTAVRLFEVASTPQQIAKLTQQQIFKLIAPSSFAERKAGEPFTTQPSVGKSVWVYYDKKTGEIGELVQNFESESSSGPVVPK